MTVQLETLFDAAGIHPKSIVYADLLQVKSYVVAKCPPDIVVRKYNPLTPKPAVTGNANSILVLRISAGCRSEWGEKAVGGIIIKGPLWVEIGDERPAIHISLHPGEKMKLDRQVHFTDQ
ncbi:hypothetical protein AVEN_218331-1 [Araneus ventricosus]|uniref:Uncharacterized protein n=1 Tax=Araneus ventricosus TaxID=182803 RepID=A0A4Y2U7W1_ARAVE|nr:hypothetical protein AVEN_262289-1 [Araneus ventricosus]GBO09105.1 hypothetical protein AVEN_218331-1 [Araneus ventricosus]